MDFPFQLRSDREFDVVGFGTNAVDFLIQVPQYPSFNSKIELSAYTQAAGGEVATTMAGLQRLGLRTAYVGRFGGDDAGSFGMRSLIEEGVDVSSSQVIPSARNQIAFIIIDERNGERTVIWKRDSGLAFTADEAPINIVERSSVLHLTPHDLGASIRMAEAARASGTMISIDIDRVQPGIEELLSLVDLLICSADLPGQLSSVKDHETALAEMAARFGCGVVGITLGEAGSLLYSGGEYFRTAAFQVPGGCRDTTGAGDSFRAGLLFGLITGRTIETSAAMANAVAALKCRAVGARTSLPDRDELLRFIDGQAV